MPRGQGIDAGRIAPRERTEQLSSIDKIAKTLNLSSDSLKAEINKSANATLFALNSEVSNHGTCLSASCTHDSLSKVPWCQNHLGGVIASLNEEMIEALCQANSAQDYKSILEQQGNLYKEKLKAQLEQEVAA